MENNYYDIDSIKNNEENSTEKKNKNKGLFASGVIVGMASALLIICVVFLGVKVSRLAAAKNSGETISISDSDDTAVDKTTVEKLQLLETTIDKYFYLHDVTDEELQEGIYKGMLEALDDPYSEYYTAEELNELMTETEGVYYGIGAYVSLDTETTLPKISGVIEGTPAEEAQLRANDLIYEVDGTSTYGLSLSEAVALIKGPENTEVVLTIIREGESDYLQVPVTRRKVETPTVSVEMLDGDMAYIQIEEFDDITVDQFADALATAKASDMKGLILDLRGNPGGSLTAVVDIARMILPEGMIVYTEDKNNKRTEYTCDGTKELDVPLVVLVDMNSASAAEILSGAIQDYGIGTLVGTTTFGKGIVQQVIPFSDGSAVKLTISSYFTPNGRNIHGTGIEPDIVCEFDSESYYDAENPVDNQLEKAKEVLSGLIK
jgi:carboxyl-terminal processing protease